MSNGVLSSVGRGSITVAALVFVFFALESSFPERKQKLWRPGLTTDVLWGLVGGVLTPVLQAGVVLFAARLALTPPTTVVTRQPVWLQLLEYLVGFDVIGYWIHRGFHGQKFLWSLHAVHHSSEELDWLSAVRRHWLETTVVQCVVVAITVYCIGFSPGVLLTGTAVTALWTMLTHANVGWSFGVFGVLLVSPEFHRWHHSAEKQAINKNFCGMFPVIDMVFGTYYRRPGRASREYGLGFGQHMSPSFIRQVIHPWVGAIGLADDVDVAAAAPAASSR